MADTDVENISAIDRSAQSPGETSGTASAVEPRARILDFVLRQCAPAQLPRRWAFLGQSPSAQRLQVKPVELCAALQGNFDLSSLIDSRVLSPNRDGGVRLSR